MIKRYIKNFKASKTIRAAFYKNVAGIATVVASSLGYFENLMTPTTFATVTGVLAIIVGLYDHYLRTVTIKPLGDK